MSWQVDNQLKEDLEQYVRLNYRKAEILEYIRRDYGGYCPNGCSIPTLSRMLSYFQIKYIDYSIPIEDIQECISAELKGSGKDLGYRAMTAKVRQKYGINVSRDVVYAVMTTFDRDGLKRRQLNFKQKNRDKTFTSKGVYWFLSIDGHDKMMGYQNSTFPIAIYGMMDQASRKILMLKCWTSNSDPRLIGMWCAQWLKTSHTLPCNIRLDRGTETGKLAVIHCFLRSQVGDIDDDDVTECLIYGPSTSNQIERWWRELHERLEKRIKKEITSLLIDNIYNPHLEAHRNLFAFIMIPLVQRELDDFKDIVWNTHRKRKQKGTALPDGVPNIIYEFPHAYGLRECGFHVSSDAIENAQRQADVYPESIDYLEEDFRDKCENLIPSPADIAVTHIRTAFMHLKDNIFSNSN